MTRLWLQVPGSLALPARLFVIGVLGFLVSHQMCRAAEVETSIDFARDIRPILAKKCFRCHGQAATEGGLRLDRREAATSELPSGGVAVVPGEPHRSILLRRITAEDAEQRMPAEAESLPPREIELLSRWIAGKAPYAEHWSFVAPRRPAVPMIDGAPKRLSPIDAFVRARLMTVGIRPSPRAERYTLLRRLHLDLTGLLPSPTELAEFINDETPHAYEKLVDRLLDSPHFGERWARHWLDLARYGDSSGYENDVVRPNAWRYRDWLIQAFNDDMPFDQFVLEQLAGDLFSEPTLRNLTATGFLRMNIKNTETGLNQEDYRNREIVDRLNTTGTAFLGMTIGCAQCHDHKYDPISQREYYQLYGFFANTVERDHDLPGTPDEQETYRIAKAEYEGRKARLDQLRALYMSIAGRKDLVQWQNWVADENGRYAPLLEQLDAAIAAGADQWHHQIRTADARRYGFAEEVTLLLAKDVDAVDRLVQLKEYYGELSAVREKLKSRTQSPAQRLSILDDDVNVKTSLLASEADQSDEQVRVRAQFIASLSSRMQETADALTQIRMEQRHIPKPSVMTVEEAAKERRATHVLLRGDFKQQGEEVEPQTPAVFPSMRILESEPQRLGLARWIASAENPLTARVAVNRIWKYLFGSGLVRSLDDFGTQGEPPTHPELLDWLAIEFCDQGWSRKAIIRQIVLSETYQQQSRFRTDLAASDPDNMVLARQSRLRVEAEIIRDLFLVSSGLLHRELGGQTIRPAIPDSVRRYTYKYTTYWIESDRPQRYRRGMYIHFKRTSPFPSLIAFDAPESSVCQAMRDRSNTPMQALTTLNDPVFMELTRELTRRIVTEAPTANVVARIQFGSLLCLSRPLRSQEVQVLEELYRSGRAQFDSDPDRAARVIQDVRVPGISDAELAAWFGVTRALTNLDEFVTRQ